MSARRSGHVALAVAGLIAGLPAAAVLQWMRPIPAVVWLELPLRAQDATNASGPGAMATRPGGPRLTVLSGPRVPVLTGRAVGAPFGLHPAPLYAVAARIGLTGRFIPDELRLVIHRSPGVDVSWQRKTLMFRAFLPLPTQAPPPASGPK